MEIKELDLREKNKFSSFADGLEYWQRTLALLLFAFFYFVFSSIFLLQFIAALTKGNLFELPILIVCGVLLLIVVIIAAIIREFRITDLTRMKYSVKNLKICIKYKEYNATIKEISKIISTIANIPSKNNYLNEVLRLLYRYYALIILPIAESGEFGILEKTITANEKIIANFESGKITQVPLITQNSEKRLIREKKVREILARRYSLNEKELADLTNLDTDARLAKLREKIKEKNKSNSPSQQILKKIEENELLKRIIKFISNPIIFITILALIASYIFGTPIQINVG